MNIFTSTFKKFSRTTLLIYILFLSIFGALIYQAVTNVQARKLDYIQISDSNYEKEIELEYGIPLVIVAEVSVPSSTIFGGYVVDGFYIKANYSSNNGSIWINDQNGDIIWKNNLYHAIETHVRSNITSIRKYSLWANSSTLGNNTLYFTFRAEMFHAGNIGLIVLIISIPIIIIVIIVIEKGRTKDSRSVKFAKKVGERLATKYEDKYHEKVARLFGDKFKRKGKNFCPECGVEIKSMQNRFCSECGIRLNA